MKAGYLSQTEGESEVIELDPEDAGSRRYPLRTRNPREYPGFMLYQAVYDSSDPVTVQDAISRQDSEEWKHAMRKELESLKENKVWELVDMPAGAKVVRSK
jgi:hypothetical protein